MRTNLLNLLLMAVLILPIGQIDIVEAHLQGVQYLSPVPGSTYNPAGTNILVRYGDIIDPHSVSSQLFQITGSASGNHAGKVVIADDQKTLIFKPDHPFNIGETVQVNLLSGIVSVTGNKFTEVSFSFSISKTDLSSSEVFSTLNNLRANEILSINRLSTPSTIAR
ncbi:MAG: Ig-like domain-containing protein, partial [Omnitrophica WOR_2 bacterium]